LRNILKKIPKQVIGYSNAGHLFMTEVTLPFGETLHADKLASHLKKEFPNWSESWDFRFDVLLSFDDPSGSRLRVLVCVIKPEMEVSTDKLDLCLPRSLSVCGYAEKLIQQSELQDFSLCALEDSVFYGVVVIHGLCAHYVEEPLLSPDAFTERCDRFEQFLKTDAYYSRIEFNDKLKINWSEQQQKEGLEFLKQWPSLKHFNLQSPALAHRLPRLRNLRALVRILLISIGVSFLMIAPKVLEVRKLVYKNAELSEQTSGLRPALAERDSLEQKLLEQWVVMESDSFAHRNSEKISDVMPYLRSILPKDAQITGLQMRSLRGALLVEFTIALRDWDALDSVQKILRSDPIIKQVQISGQRRERGSGVSFKTELQLW
jgi:hypothetical protein